jgi:endonuclease-3
MPAKRRKRAFDVEVVMDRIRRSIAERGVEDAAMFALASEGYTTLFEQLVACIISIRTFDETMLTCERARPRRSRRCRFARSTR